MSLEDLIEGHTFYWYHQEVNQSPELSCQLQFVCKS